MTAWNQTDDVDGDCNAHCYIADDHGDNTATMRCSLPSGHDGPHREVFRDGTCVLTWETDERCYHDGGTTKDEVDGALYCSKCYRDLTK